MHAKFQIQLMYFCPLIWFCAVLFYDRGKVKKKNKESETGVSTIIHKRFV